MKEIKFRAWNLGEMHHFTLEDISANGAVTGCEHGCFDLTGKDGKVEIMQYICLKDKDGKEIYEGDIVTENSRVGEVRWSVGGFWFLYNGGKDTVHFAGLGGRPMKWQTDAEVIGNIYENRELLK